MALWRIILAIFFPPIAVLDKGCGAMVLVGALTLVGWVPGVVAALIISAMDENRFGGGEQRFVDVPNVIPGTAEKPKRKGAFARLVDGETVEVIDDDGRLPGQRRARGEHDV